MSDPLRTLQRADQSTDMLAALTATDRAWALRRRTTPAAPAYLIAMAAAARHHPPDLLGLLADLVHAVTGQWDPRGDPTRQTAAALMVIRRAEQHIQALTDRVAELETWCGCTKPEVHAGESGSTKGAA